MAMCAKGSLHRVSGTVGMVHTVVGVATDDYQALRNKPRINGVELAGDVALDLGHFAVKAQAEGDTLVIQVVTGG